MPPSRDESATSTQLLALGPASRLLGVDPDTLRRWADDGRIEVAVTPGGHRRFPRRSLERLMRASSDPHGAATLARLGATPQRLTAAYRRTYRVTRAIEPDALQAVPEPDRPAWRDSGRELVTALVHHLDAVDPAEAAVALEAAAALAEAQGQRLAVAGSSLTEAVALFVAARRPFLVELGRLGRRRALDARQLAGLFDAASTALDACLLRFIQGHRTAG